MKSAEAHALKDPDLIQALKNARHEAFNLRLRHATGELEDTAKISASKREIARLLTVAAERGIDLDAELRKFDD